MHLQLVARFSGVREPLGDLRTMTVSETLPDTRFQKSSTTSAGIVGTIHARFELRNVLIQSDKKGGAAYVTRTRDPIITNDVLYQLS